MIKITEEQWVEILERVEGGDAPDDILSSYPEVGTQIAAALKMVDNLSQLASRPYVSAKQASRQAFLVQAADKQADLLLARTPGVSWRRLFRTLSFATVALFLLLFGGAVLAREALPGDFLYSPKIALESARMSLTEDSSAILQLSDGYQAERITEVESLLRLGRSAEVEFEGPIEEIMANRLIVAGLTVLFDSETRLEGRPQIGELARVVGYTEDGQLFGRIIIALTGIVVPDDSEELINPAQTPPRPTLNSVRPQVEAATPTPSPTSSPTPSPTASQEPTPTSSPAPLPAPTDDSSSGGGDNSDGSEDPEDNEDPEDHEGSEDDEDHGEPEDPEDHEKPEHPDHD